CISSATVSSTSCGGAGPTGISRISVRPRPIRHDHTSHRPLISPATGVCLKGVRFHAPRRCEAWRKEHTMTNNPTIEELSHEGRTFPPPEEFAANANVTAEEYDKAAADRIGYWEEQAKRITWDTPFDTVLDWSDKPFATWYVGGRLNAAYNCVDRHVENGLGDRVAYYFEGESGDTRTITYSDLLREVSKAANALTELGVKTGDRVAIYMPMIPETVFAMLACARLG